MAFNEVRKDYLLDRWAVIATGRSRRPTDFALKQREAAKIGVCPMCPGNEHMTPPAVLAYVPSGKKIRKVKDSDGSRHRNWLIRCVSNLYPAFTPPNGKISLKKTAECSDMMPAIGHHEVLIESPNHDEHPANAGISQLTQVINAYIDRLRELSAKPYVQYVSIFRNHGLEAGASLSHAHSQIMTTPFMPRTLKDELEASRRFWKQNEKCVFCDILEKELDGPRLILQNSGFAVFAPWASINPLEFWILPKKHEATLLGMPQSEIRIFAETLKASLGALQKLLNDPPYNYGIHLAMDKTACNYYHWHCEVYPKLAIWAGFEKSTGMYINTVTPETAAESLRKIISPDAIQHRD